MKKSEQTNAVKERLYNLTLAFVRKYQPRLYYQYRGDKEDLASEFYTQFLTAKSREKGKEESLLDKYNPEITSLEYLVKVSVQRMLIDRSRADKYKFRSIDHFVDEFGDVITKSFNLSTEDDDITIDEMEFSPDFAETVKLKFSRLSSYAQRAVKSQLLEYFSVLAPQFQDLFSFILEPEPNVELLYFSVVINDSVENCLCQQVTDKTACLVYNNNVYNFDRINGAGRGKDYRQWHLTIESLERLKDITIYKSGYDRKSIVQIAL